MSAYPIYPPPPLSIVQSKSIYKEHLLFKRITCIHTLCRQYTDFSEHQLHSTLALKLCCRKELIAGGPSIGAPCDVVSLVNPCREITFTNRTTNSWLWHRKQYLYFLLLLVCTPCWKVTQYGSILLNLCGHYHPLEQKKVYEGWKSQTLTTSLTGWKVFIFHRFRQATVRTLLWWL